MYTNIDKDAAALNLAKEHQTLCDIHRVSQAMRTLAILVQASQKTHGQVTLNDLIKPQYFDLVVQVTKSMSTDKDAPALNLAKEHQTLCDIHRVSQVTRTP